MSAGNDWFGISYSEETTMITDEMGQGGKIVTLVQCAKLRPYSAAGLRDLKFKAFDRKNSRGEVIKGNGTGSAGVWLQIGRKVLVDLDAFDRWIESHRLTH
jgi:hypothetical protein